MKPQNVATLIEREIQNLPKNSLLRYVPPLNQIWAISGKNALLFDLVTNSWYKRKFNSQVVDVISIGEEVIVIKSDRVSKLDEGSFQDAGEALHWRWQGQRLLSQHDYFLKRTQISYIPLGGENCGGEIRVGAVVVDLSTDKKEGKRSKGQRYLGTKSEKVFGNKQPIYLNPQPIFNYPTILKESRNVFRSKYLDIGGQGYQGRIIFNSIILDLAEV